MSKSGHVRRVRGWRFVAALVGVAVGVGISAPDAGAFGNNRWVHRPNCGNNWVASGGNINNGWAETVKGANNTCSGHMFAGLKAAGGNIVWVQNPTDAFLQMDPADVIGRHRGCAACSVTTS